MSLVVNVAELLRRPGSVKDVHDTARAEGWRVVDTEVPDGADVSVDLELESLTDGIVVAGHVVAPWVAACRRCLDPVAGRVDAEVRELYQQRAELDEAFTFRGEQLDLEPMVREVVLLELPLAPVCRVDCAGLCPVCGQNRNEVDCRHVVGARDDRWAALDALLEPASDERPDGRLDHPEA